MNRTHRHRIRSAPLAAALALTLASGAGLADETSSPGRIVSIGGAVTEILYALGAEDRIAAVDTTSDFPPEAADRPDVGYMRALSAEGVLSVDPDLMLAQEGAGPPDAVAVLKESGVSFVTVPEGHSPGGVLQKIRTVGAAIGKPAAAATLAAEVEHGFSELAAMRSALPAKDRKRVLFVLSFANGRVTVGGKDTSADAIIGLAGGVNAAEGVTGFKPMVDEAVIAAAPDVILAMRRGEHALSAAEVFALPALQATPAAETGSLVVMDGLYLLGFGPRTPAAARDLAAALYPDSVPAVPSR